jgi:hypothetical protein
MEITVTAGAAGKAMARETLNKSLL